LEYQCRFKNYFFQYFFKIKHDLISPSLSFKLSLKCQIIFSANLQNFPSSEKTASQKTEQARKERSREIQALVDWVRRRDPRVKQYRIKLEERQKEIAEKAKRKRDEKRMNDLIARV